MKCRSFVRSANGGRSHRRYGDVSAGIAGIPLKQRGRVPHAESVGRRRNVIAASVGLHMRTGIANSSRERRGARRPFASGARRTPDLSLVAHWQELNEHGSVSSLKSQPPPLPPGASDPHLQWRRQRFRTRCIVGFSLAAFVVHAFAFINAFSPVGLRFSSGSANVYFLLVASVLPAATCVLILSGCVGSVRKVGAPLTGFLAIPGLAFAALLTLWVVPMKVAAGDRDCVRLKTISTGADSVSVYLTDGGATTSYGILAMQERPLGLGVSLVRRLQHWNRAESANLQLTGPGSVKVAVDCYQAGAGKHRFGVHPPTVPPLLLALPFR